MISGVGVDIVQVAAIAESIEHYGKEYLERMFTKGEIAYCDAVPSAMQRYAARVAAKEAANQAGTRACRAIVPAKLVKSQTSRHDLILANDRPSSPALPARRSDADRRTSV